ncbi:UNVERIFIED_CONTAM: putative galacturonosyltransferase 6 [Sesamum calycinum]|uniref:Hexosyltransferase n=1 Tax=Sesamum calycinum TaxID=2727403 RepID=A0AAW2SAB4_9LAMI
MKAFRRCSRILILWLLCVSVFVPVFLLSYRLKHTNDVSKDFVEDLSIIKHRTETQTLSAIEQEEIEGLKEPLLEVYKDDTSKSADNSSTSEDTRYSGVGIAANDAGLSENNATRHDKDEGGQERQQQNELPASGKKEEPHTKRIQHDQVSNARLRRKLDEKVQAMKDQLIRAKTYLSFTPSNSSSHFVKELKLRMKEVERAISHCTQDFRLSRSDMQRMKAMESTLFKARRIFPDCAAMIKKLRAMTYNAEEQVRSKQNQETFLRGLVEEPCQEEPERIVFHIVTDSLNVPAISMWFLSNPPGKATVHVEEHRKFPMVIHQIWCSSAGGRGLTRLWSINMRGKVNGAVETCKEGEISFRRMDMAVEGGCGRQEACPLVGSLFYEPTVALDSRWQVLGLGYDSGARQEDIDQASVLHFDGILKPWLDIGIERYKYLWRKHVKYEHPYLQQCNVHK